MVFDLKPLLSGKVRAIPIDFSLSVGFDYPGVVFHEPAHVRGELRERAGVVTLRCDLTLRYETSCDRCLAPLTREICVPVRCTITEGDPPEEEDNAFGEEESVFADPIPACDGLLSLAEPLNEALLLAIPTKHLCREDCRGLCPRCGKNLNEGPCACLPDTASPLWDEVRAKLFPEGGEGDIGEDSLAIGDSPAGDTAAITSRGAPGAPEREKSGGA